VTGIFLKLLGILSNTEVARGKQICKELFKKAGASIKIVSGNLSSSFYNDPEIIQALDEASQRGVCIEIIHGTPMDLGNGRLFELQEQGKIMLYALKEYPIHQFIVVDGKHVRVEEPHYQKQGSRRAYAVHNTLFLGRKLEVEFNKLRIFAKSTKRGESK
jgi:hypothetical protein